MNISKEKKCKKDNAKIKQLINFPNHVTYINIYKPFTNTI